MVLKLRLHSRVPVDRVHDLAQIGNTRLVGHLGQHLVLPHPFVLVLAAHRPARHGAVGIGQVTESDRARRTGLDASRAKGLTELRPSLSTP